MAKEAQHRAVANHRARQAKAGFVRFELKASVADRALLRALAQQLARMGSEAGWLRERLRGVVNPGQARQGGVLAALRRSPLVGAEIDLVREREDGRPVDL